jgi:transcription elongation GreA/GreB family factor
MASLKSRSSWRIAAAHAGAQADADRSALARVASDLRYWPQRRSSAEVVTAPAVAAKVQFGSTVTVACNGGRRQTWRIVGEDEAEPANGTLSYVSPVARAHRPRGR